MYIKRVIFTNFGRHRKLDLSFQRGLVGLIGPNGSGKSTITDGLYAALTNDFRRFAGVKNDNICLDADEKESSSIHLFIEHQGVNFELFRGLRSPAKSWLKIDGQIIENATRIELELREKLGLNLKLLDTYVFVPQWEMFSFLSQTAGERAATYQMLCGTEKARDIVKAIETYLEKTPELSIEIIDISDELRSDMAKQQQAIDVAKANINDRRNQVLTAEALQGVEAMIARRTVHDSVLPRLADARVKVAALAPKLDGLEKAAKEWEDLVAETDQMVQTMEPSANRATDAISRYNNYKSTQQSLAGLDAAIADGQAKLQAREDTAPVLNPQDAKLYQLIEESTLLRQQLRQDVEFVNKFENSGLTECPTCGTPTDKLADRIDKLKIRSDQAKLKIEELDTVISDIKVQRIHVLQHQSTVETMKKNIEINRNRRQLIAASLVECPAESLEELEAILKDFVALKDNYRSCVQQRDDASKVWQQAKQQHELYCGVAKDLEKEVADNTVSDRDLAEAKRRRDLHIAATAAIEYEKKAGAAAVRELAKLKEELEALYARMARQQKSKQFAERLKLIKEIMHPQALPQFVAQRNLQDMEHDINHELDNFGSPFWVEVADDLSFIAHPAGRTAHRAERLSGGQKSVLAICFRTAICGLFDTQLDMLSLDEPTAGMDDDNRRYLSEALRQYAARVRNNRQVFMITHASELRSAFDQVVDLGVENG